MGWPKGLERTEETKLKISNTCKSKGVGSWMQGRKLSLEIKNKMKQSNKSHLRFYRDRMSLIMKGRKITWGDKISKTKTGEKRKPFSQEWIDKITKNLVRGRGSESIAWRGGISNEPYPFEFNDELKEKIRLRDGWICQNKQCSMTNKEHLIVFGHSLLIHHIDYNKKNIQENNLITLCRQCNLRANFSRDIWQKYYTAIIDERN